MRAHTSYGCCRVGRAFDESGRWVRDTIERVGWAVIAISGDTTYAFTVGVWHSYDLPELAMFGLRERDMQLWLNTCVALVRNRGDAAGGELIEGVLAHHPVQLKRIDASWQAPLFGPMCGYYEAADVPMRQVVWPDRDGRWPWEDAASAACRQQQPQAWIPVQRHPNGVWRLIGELSANWPFPRLEPDTTVMASADVVAGRRPIVAVTHGADGGWDFLAERGYSDEASGWVHFGVLYQAQPWLRRFVDLAPDTQAYRDDDGRWRTRPFSGGA